ncbi:MAG: prephenate dehydratase [Firmicutes bacterium]|jgi:prephenate dehydratase/chorismate mutase/prephenate dehydratase|nr:prephenate dehydratase [Bacillota bacterium]
MQQVIAFQGEPGAYSEEAVVRFFGEIDGVNRTALPCRTLAAVFDAINRGAATDGLIPIENSLAGSINESYDLLVRNNLQVYGEVILPVNHCLLALPGESISEIRRVYSHPQALAQCDQFLNDLGAEAIASYDTAGSARTLREAGMRGAAAIASRRAASLYGLAVLAEGIQTNPSNRTRFYAVGHRSAPRGRRNKTVLVIVTEHRPGALYWCLGAFAYRQINMTKLESRPSRGRPWEYVFFLDIDAHVDDPDCQAALTELKTKASSVRVLGSFPQASDDPA